MVVAERRPPKFPEQGHASAKFGTSSAGLLAKVVVSVLRCCDKQIRMKLDSVETVPSLRGFVACRRCLPMKGDTSPMMA